jgi:hypothetical protein
MVDPTTTYEKGQLYQISIIDFKPDPNQHLAFLDLLEKTGAKLDAIDTSAWSADDHNSLGIFLTALRDKIDTRLAALPPASQSTALA